MEMILYLARSHPLRVAVVVAVTEQETEVLAVVAVEAVALLQVVERAVLETRLLHLHHKEIMAVLA
jgi:hypothetical protein